MFGWVRDAVAVVLEQVKRKIEPDHPNAEHDPNEDAAQGEEGHKRLL